jgi:hypothetical protein
LPPLEPAGHTDYASRARTITWDVKHPHEHVVAAERGLWAAFQLAIRPLGYMYSNLGGSIPAFFDQ